MSQYVTHKELDEKFSQLQGGIDEVLDVMKDFMGQVASQFISIDKRFDKMDQRFDILEASVKDRFKEVNDRLDASNAKYDHLITTLDSFISRLDTHELDMIARDSQFKRLLEWARKVSEKTGIPLENL